MRIPTLDSPLAPEHLSFLEAFSLSCRRTIIECVKQAQSGHPGGSLSCIDYLTLLYAFIISQTGEKVVVSNGHISPGVYSVLAELGYIPKEEVQQTFRKIGSIYEGHVTRHVPGVWYGTGPLGIGVSAGAGFAMAEKLKGSEEKVYLLMGDGEAQEGQVYEMLHFAAKNKLDNIILFVDDNKVQLSDSVQSIMPVDLRATFEAAGWHVLEADGHNFEEMWKRLGEAHATSEQPTVILGHTIMGKGVQYMEPDGTAYKSTWHGKAPDPSTCDEILKHVVLSQEQQKMIDTFRDAIAWHPTEPEFIDDLTPDTEIHTGTPLLYAADASVDCRTAYGKALLDLAKNNKQITASTADLRASVMTQFVYQEIPERHIEVGIAEQHMVSCAGGMSLNGFIPFVSTFGAFMSSRAKDQARVNDVNRTNVKMVATHCGLSVGEDGPTHQAIDDMGSFLGLLHTHVIEPADPNHTDRIIRYAASRHGNFYIRMGRHKFPIITREDGTPFYGTDYAYEYGKSDVIRTGGDLTIFASGAMVSEALKAHDRVRQEFPDQSVEIIAVSSIKKFDHNVIESALKTRKAISIEDHNTFSGLGSQLARHFMANNIHLELFHMIGVEAYQLSGTAADLYHAAEIDSEAIYHHIVNIFKT